MTEERSQENHVKNGVASLFHHISHACVTLMNVKPALSIVSAIHINMEEVQCMHAAEWMGLEEGRTRSLASCRGGYWLWVFGGSLGLPMYGNNGGNIGA